MFFKKRKNKKKYTDIAPEEIFPDAYNFPNFDKTQFEGRIEKPIKKKVVKFVGVVFVIIIGIFVYKLWDLQVLTGASYVIKSEQNILNKSILFSNRGIVQDRNGNYLTFNNENKGEDFARRKYIEKEGFSHLLGYVGYPKKDSSGNYYRNKLEGMNGVENFFDDILRGENGIKLNEVDVFLNVISESIIKKPIDGKDLVLTVDINLQEKFFEYIKKTADSSGFVGGAGIIMDINNGEILSMVSYPEYDSQVMSEGKDRDRISSFFSNENTPFLNRATQGLYAPGSIIKPFIALGALNERVVRSDEEIVSKGEIKIQNPYNPDLYSTFLDWKAHGPVDVKKAIAVSSNVYFYVVGGGFENKIGLGISRIEKYIKSFDIGNETGISGFPESDGVIPGPEWKKDNFDGEDWRVGDTYNTAIGQYGFQVTPLQMTKAMSAIVNNGILITPKIIMSNETEKKNISLDIKNKYYDVVKEGMRDSVLYGTTKGLNVPYVNIAGKTGTAQVGVSKKRVNSWVVGFFPYENPRYVFTVVMEKGPEHNLIGASFVMRSFFDWLNQSYPEYLK